MDMFFAILGVLALCVITSWCITKMILFLTLYRTTMENRFGFKPPSEAATCFALMIIEDPTKINDVVVRGSRKPLLHYGPFAHAWEIKGLGYDQGRIAISKFDAAYLLSVYRSQEEEKVVRDTALAFDNLRTRAARIRGDIRDGKIRPSGDNS